MRIVQLIDSLEAGGMERVAVNYANCLAEKVDFSGLVVTRAEGMLKSQIAENVGYLFLKKRKTLDLKSIARLRKFVVSNKVTIIHAHGTSFFTATLLKFYYPKIKIVWHEHYGARANQSAFSNLVLLFCSFYFKYILVVNQQLVDWVQTKLLFKHVAYMPNFSLLSENENAVTILKGQVDKRIVCLANLKQPKNHILLLQAFTKMNLESKNWSLHLIGKDYNDEYSTQLREHIIKYGLQEAVFLYGSRDDIKNILNQSAIGVLCSTDEGFPMVLLEYGLAKLPVISTNAGFCSTIITNGHSGLLFDPFNEGDLIVQLHKLLENKDLRNLFANSLYQTVAEQYKKDQVINLLLVTYKTLQQL